jgi:hypothetical protein
MTLCNMRANGVRSLDVSCWQCHHRTILCADLEAHNWKIEQGPVREGHSRLMGE